MNYGIKKIEVSYTILSDVKNMHFVRSESEKIFALVNIDDESFLFKMKLVIDEIVNNAIEHGSDIGHDVVINISIDLDNKKLSIKVSDDGTKNKKGLRAIDIIESIKYAKENQVTNNLSKSNIRGRGLAHIVNDWADELIISDNENGGITVNVVKNL